MRLRVYDQAKRLSKNDSRNNSLLFAIHIGKDLAPGEIVLKKSFLWELLDPVGTARYSRTLRVCVSISFWVVFFRMTMLLQIRYWGLETDRMSPGPV